MNEWPPPNARLMARGTVYGEAKGAGSKVSGVAYRKDPATGKSVPITKNGRIVTFTKDTSGDKGKEWRHDVQAAVLEVLPIGGVAGLLDLPLGLELCFYRVRPKTHYGTGRNSGVLKPTAPAYPAVAPDATKLVRAFEDALNKVVWHDDSRVCEQRISKRYGTQARVEWALYALPTTAQAETMVGSLPIFDEEGSGHAGNGDEQEEDGVGTAAAGGGAGAGTT